MKKFITWALTMMVAGMVWGQIPYKPNINSSSWNTTQKFTSTKANLKHGVGDLIVADNLMYTAGGLGTLSSILIIRNPPTLPGEPANMERGIGVACGVGSIICVIASNAQRRRGLKRIYWGINGITIPLN